WLHTEEVLSRFSCEESKARFLWQDYIEQGVGESRRSEFHQGSHLGRILGDDHFAERAIQTSGRYEMAKAPAIARIIQAVCSEYGVEPSALYESGKGRESSEPRAMAALVVQHIEGVTLTALAKELGRELSSLSQSAGRLRKRIRSHDDLQERLLTILNKIKTPICQA
ncbi:transposase, partial [Mariprofundus erugo]